MQQFFYLLLFTTSLQAQVWEHQFYSENTAKTYQIKTDTKHQVVFIDKLKIPFVALQAPLLQLSTILKTDSLKITENRIYGWKKDVPFVLPFDLWENLQEGIRQEQLKKSPESFGVSIDKTGAFGFFNAGFFSLGFLLICFVTALLLFYIRRLQKQKKAEIVRKEELEMMRNTLLKDFEVKTKIILAEIHDGPLQDLARFSRQLTAINPQELQLQMQQTKSGIEEVAKELRNISANITPSELTDIGLDSAMRSLLQKFQLANPKIKVEANFQKERLSLPENTRLMLYRIFQEGLNNIEKHAKASEVKVSLVLENGFNLQIVDNGIGFNEAKLPTNGHHLGLLGIKARCEGIGANLKINSTLGKGTVLRVTKGMMA